MQPCLTQYAQACKRAMHCCTVPVPRFPARKVVQASPCAAARPTALLSHLAPIPLTPPPPAADKAQWKLGRAAKKGEADRCAHLRYHAVSLCLSRQLVDVARLEVLCAASAAAVHWGQLSY